MTLHLLKSQTGRTLIESHRGIDGHMPENSWPAIQLGHALGADLIEMDVQLSRDGVAFIRHNYQLPDGRWSHEVPWNELEKLRIEGEFLPKLEDVLIWAHDAGVYLSLDMKTFFKPEGILVKEVVRLLERTGMEENVLLLFFDHHELLNTKCAHPELAVRALVTGRLLNFADYLQTIRADSVSVSYGLLCPEDIDRFHEADIAVALLEYWNPKGNLHQKFDIDIFSVGNPVEGKEILSRQ